MVTVAIRWMGCCCRRRCIRIIWTVRNCGCCGSIGAIAMLSTGRCRRCRGGFLLFRFLLGFLWAFPFHSAILKPYFNLNEANEHNAKLVFMVLSSGCGGWDDGQDMRIVEIWFLSWRCRTSTIANCDWHESGWLIWSHREETVWPRLNKNVFIRIDDHVIDLMRSTNRKMPHKHILTHPFLSAQAFVSTSNNTKCEMPTKTGKCGRGKNIWNAKIDDFTFIWIYHGMRSKSIQICTQRITKMELAEQRWRAEKNANIEVSST